jgi:hypothetical protein
VQTGQRFPQRGDGFKGKAGVERKKPIFAETFNHLPIKSHCHNDDPFLDLSSQSRQITKLFKMNLFDAARLSPITNRIGFVLFDRNSPATAPGPVNPPRVPETRG